MTDEVEMTDVLKARQWLRDLLEKAEAEITGSGAMLVPPYTADLECVLPAGEFIASITLTPRW